jgi:predicted small metal-binding protein
VKKMHKIGCADMGVKCEFKTEGEDRDQVKDILENTLLLKIGKNPNKN